MESTDRPSPAGRTARPGISALLAWAGIAVGIGYLVLIGGGIGNQAALLRLFNTLLLAAAVGVWLIIAAGHPTWRPRTAVWPAIGAVGIAYAITTVTSREPRLGLDYVAYAGLLVCGYLLLERLLAREFFASRIGALLVLLAFVVALWYLGLVIEHWVRFWQTIGRIVPPPLRPEFEGLFYGMPSGVASVSFLLWLLAFSFLGTATPWRRRVLAVLTGLIALVVFITAVRATWVGVAVAAAATAGVWLLGPDHRETVRRSLRAPRARAAIVVACLIVGGLTIVFLPAIASRFAEPGTDARFVFYAASLRMFSASPLVGVGPGGWAVHRLEFTQAGETDYYIPHAHNIELETMAELGVVGLVAGIVVALAVVRLIRRGLASPDAQTRRLSWVALAGGVYLAAYQQFDFYANFVPVLFLYALTIAWLDARTSGERTRTPHSEPRARALLLAPIAAIAIVATGWLWWSEGAAIAGDRAALAIRSGEWDGALAAATSAAQQDPEMPPYQFMLGLAEAQAGAPRAAAEAFRRAASTDDFPEAWVNLARLDLDLGDPGAATTDLGRAMRLGRQHPQIALAAAALFGELGRRDAAVGALADGLIAAPSLASDPTVRSRFGAELSDAVPAAIENLPPTTGYLLALEAGQPDVARGVAGRLDPSGGALADRVIDAWGGDLAAFRDVRQAGIDRPLDAGAIALCRRLERVAQDERRGPEWSCDPMLHSATYIVVRVVPELVGRPALPGPDASWHFQYVYRRADPFDLLVPNLLHLQGSW